MVCAIAATVEVVGEMRKVVVALDTLPVHASREGVAGLEVTAKLTSMSVQVLTLVAVVPTVPLLPRLPASFREIQTELHVPTHPAHTRVIAGHHAGREELHSAVETCASMPTSVAAANPTHARASVTTQ